MRRRIPSTAALSAFEAAARHESFTRAADELHMTQSAVCRQVAALESSLGVELFRRTRRGVKLTAAGIAYGRRVAERLAALERDTLELMSTRGQGGVIELAVVPTFATHWLLPRLSAFQREHPHIQLNLHTRVRPFLFDDSGPDLALYAGDGHWPGCDTRLLMPERLIAVCAPALIAPRRRISPAQLAALPLLQQTTRPDAWRRWLAAAGVDTDRSLQGPRYELFSMSVQAALLGLGVALVPDFAAGAELAAGGLVEPATSPCESDRAYYLALPESQPAPEAVGVFARWVLRTRSDPP